MFLRLAQEEVMHDEGNIIGLMVFVECGFGKSDQEKEQINFHVKFM